jgi:hypothetical protein
VGNEQENSVGEKCDSRTGVLVFAASSSLILELCADAVEELIKTSIARSRPQATMLIVHGHDGGRQGDEDGGRPRGWGWWRRR